MGGIGGWRKAVIYKVKALLLDARTRNAILDTVYKQTKMTRTYLPANLWAELSRVYFPQLCSNLRLCLRSDSQLIDFFKFLRPVQLFPGLDVVNQCIIRCTKSSKLDKFQFSNYSESVTRLIVILHDIVVRGHVSLTSLPLSERKSHQPITEPIWGNWSKPPTTRFPFLNHFIRPGLHSGSCRQNKISGQLTYYNHNCFFQENHEKTEENKI